MPLAGQLGPLGVASTRRESGDPDATAFLTAAAISDATQRAAVNQLVLDLKAASLWSKLHALYPFVGGTEAAHKFNLKDPRDLDAAFRLQFDGGVRIHSAGGYQPNSVSWGRSKFIPNDHLPPNSSHMSYYSRTDSAAADMAEIGCFNWDAAFTRQHLIIHYIGVNGFYYSQGSGSLVFVASPSSQGFFVGSRRASATQMAYKNGVLLETTFQTFTGHGTHEATVGALNGYLSAPSNRECAFASIGEGLTDGENTALYTAVQTYQTTLGRQV